MAQQKFTIDLPKSLSPQERVAAGLDIIDFIISRSKSGKDKNNKDFPSYSSSYTKSFDFKLAGKSKSKVNLSLSNEMLNALEVLSQRSGKVTIGIPSDDDFNNAKAEGNIKGTYGQSKPIPGKKRDFMGIKDSDLKDITKKYENNDRSDILKTLLATEASRQIVSNFFDTDRLEEEQSEL